MAHPFDMLIIAALSPDEPTSEHELHRILAEYGMDEEEARAAIQDLLGRNEIRWVAFRGFCRGGRP